MNSNAEDQSGAHIVTQDGRSLIVHNGAVIPRAAYFERILWHERHEWEQRVAAFVQDGVTVFHLVVPRSPTDFFDSPFWTDEDVYPVESEWQADETCFKKPLSLNQQAEYIVAIQPEAKLYIDLGSSIPLAMIHKYPDLVQTDEDGKTHREATLASEQYLDGLDRYLRHLVRYCEGCSWGNRIIGYKIYSLGEGCMPLTLEGKMFDCSGANEQAFRAWLPTRYASVEALRAAWNHPTVTFDSACIPRDRDWLARRAAATPTLNGEPIAAGQPLHGKGLLHWIEPENIRPELDYAIFMRENFFRWVRTMTRAIKEACAAMGRARLVGIDAMKQPLLGWQILSFFTGVGDGQSFPNVKYLSGSYDVGELLDDTNLDFLWTPSDYTARGMGFAYEAEGLTDSLVLRGKTMLIENDARCYVGQGRQEQGAFRNEAETEAGLLRNAAMILSRGLYDYWCNVTGDVKSYFSDPGIHRIIGEIAPMLDRLRATPHRETRDAIAMIIDDESVQYEDFTSGYQYLSVVWQRILGLAHCGVPYRIYLLSDLKKEHFPPYKVFLFPNLFKVDDAVLDLLRAKVLRHGNIAIFGPATGITNGCHLGAEGASRLLGVPMEVARLAGQRHVIVQDQGHPISRELPANFTYGDSLVYGPLLLPEHGVVEDAGGVALGLASACWPVNRTGLFLKEFGNGAGGNGQPGLRGADDYVVLWSEAMPLPANLLRAAARYAGCNIWCEEDDVVYASDTILAIHTAKAGPRTIHLPTPRTVRDVMTGDIIGRDCRTIELQMRSPETRLFQME
jgi:hypothetical protein